MSGVVAVAHFDGAPVDPALLSRLTTYLAFRGPAAQSVYLTPHSGLGFAYRRVDDAVDRAPGPFTLDGLVSIVADARIDAQHDLMAALAARGETPIGEAVSDAELILRAYRAWGDNCVAHLAGDFMFAIWDEPRQRLFCARDQLGVKPFFYAQRGATVVVSNTLDCVRLHPSVPRDLHDQAIADFLMFGVNEDPATTVFRDIRRLPAAHAISWTMHGSATRRYWTLPVEGPIHFRRADDYPDRFMELLRVALRDRLRTRRVGVLMSGGVDSPTLAASALGVLRDSPSPFSLRAITSVYDHLVPDSERYYAGLVAKHLGIPIAYVVRDDEASLVDWDRISIHTPEPVDNPPAFAAGVGFFKRMASETPALLYGEGPDNALRYEWRRYLARLSGARDVGGLARAVTRDVLMHRRVPFWSSIRRAIFDRRPATAAEPMPAWLNDDLAARCRCSERWAERRRPATSAHPLRPASHAGFANVRWQALFEDCDLMSALSGAEICHPYLDLRLLRYLLAVPAVPWCRNKLIIRRAMRTMLPADVLRRPKTSLGVSPDFARVRASGFPRLVPCPAVLPYVNPHKVPTAPGTAPELRSALRALGLNTWLQNLEQP